ncbi:Homeobox domain [Fusarium oxysporum f. sp. vasinfectum]|uniref:Homeobox domain-containing protein n=1 Tax=Fusarium oxysporum f. sp. vasinfectum 25433 TaxID=1089449 RepID=X0KG37_FUSOX|nr:hypothetical protein FOTG_19026 [Fusarium oxysporum f. sp. vasinfectum 25433]KAK2471021.1 hypothetical protein H9L39_17252 [Fusarium oxysporum f. sp. albedinis]KAK2670406.1 Homeobox domain [Fusarium oxysporum f. sp. vasinfectum]KAK2930475.1 Homeobox domain [Fusarium oxysporum f. sp. vasinfectum]
MSSTQPSQSGKVHSSRDGDDEKLNDEDMLDSGGNNSARTPAGRAGTRCKRKRFRLTHQQTRFLISEFAKQPQPDAAHCERLSQEISGLSQRQVQVWFQNRRAKLNRLNPADRDRMTAMRAAPEGFDNVQALHSSNGAVHGIDVPMSSSKTSIMQLYALRMLTPLSPDTRRYKTSELASLMTMRPGLGAMSYGPAGSMTSPSLELWFSPGPSDQSTYDSLPESQELTAHLNNTKGIGLSSSYIDPALIDPINSSLGLPI